MLFCDLSLIRGRAGKMSRCHYSCRNTSNVINFHSIRSRSSNFKGMSKQFPVMENCKAWIVLELPKVAAYEFPVSSPLSSPLSQNHWLLWYRVYRKLSTSKNGVLLPQQMLEKKASIAHKNDADLKTAVYFSKTTVFKPSILLNKNITTWVSSAIWEKLLE